MIRIVCVGNLKEKYWTDACQEYIKRITKYSKIEIIELKESTMQPIAVALKEEAKEIMKHVKGYVIRMAIKGSFLSSEELAEKINKITLSGQSDITFIIGSSCGIDPSVSAHFDLSFSKMTFPHQLSRVLLLEQIYRSFSILNHGKYHK